MRSGTLLALCLLALAAPAWADDGTSVLDGRRDALIDKITRGVDYDASVRGFVALLAERQKILAPAELARQLAIANRAWHQEYNKSADAIAGYSCRLAVDPMKPPFVDQDLLLADWGKVTRVETVRMPPKNALDPGEEIPLAEVKGMRGLYRFRVDRFAFPGQKLAPTVGDLMMVCENVEPNLRRNNPHEQFPPGWEGVLQHGRGIPIAAPPRIVKKAKWDPIELKEVAFFWAIKRVEWKFPVDKFFLAKVTVLSDEGNGRYLIDASQQLAWLLEVPPSVKRRELLVPGRIAWVIAGRPRFDPGLKRLVLTAEDIEERYITGVGETNPPTVK
jgi:hypothetical protein